MTTPATEMAKMPATVTYRLAFAVYLPRTELGTYSCTQGISAISIRARAGWQRGRQQPPQSAVQPAEPKDATTQGVNSSNAVTILRAPKTAEKRTLIAEPGHAGGDKEGKYTGKGQQGEQSADLALA